MVSPETPIFGGPFEPDPVSTGVGIGFRLPQVFRTCESFRISDLGTDMKCLLPLFLFAIPALTTTALAQQTSDNESIIEEIVVTSEFRKS